MSKQAIVSMIVGMILGSAGVWELTARAQMQAPGFRPFGSKTVLVMTKSGDGAEFENPEIRTIGNRTFVVGRYAMDSKYTRKIIPGSPALWLSFDEVMQFIEMPVPAEKKNAIDPTEKKDVK